MTSITQNTNVTRINTTFLVDIKRVCFVYSVIIIVDKKQLKSNYHLMKYNSERKNCCYFSEFHRTPLNFPLPNDPFCFFLFSFIFS